MQPKSQNRGRSGLVVEDEISHNGWCSIQHVSLDFYMGFNVYAQNLQKETLGF